MSHPVTTLGDLLPSLLTIQVWRRHLLVWRKTLLASLVGSFGEPLLVLLGIGFGLGYYLKELEGLPYPVFLGAGVLAASAMNTATFEALYGGFTRMTRQNTFHAMLATPLRVADIVTGEVVWAASKALLAGVAIFVVGSLLGAFPAPTALLTLPVVVLAGLVFGGLGMVMTALSPSYEFFLYYTTLFINPMFLFCGVFYPVEALPAPVAMLTQLLPLTHVIALMRPLAAGLPLVNPLIHLAVLGLFAVGSLLLAIHLVRRRLIV